MPCLIHHSSLWPSRNPRALELMVALIILLAWQVPCTASEGSAAPSWPCWRGPFGNGSAPDPGVPLVEDITKAKLVWQSEQKIPSSDEDWRGAWRGGFASPIVAEGKVFIFYFLPHGRTSPAFNKAEQAKFGKRGYQGKGKLDSWELNHVDDVLQAFDAETGKVVWTFRDERGLAELAHKNGGHHTACYEHGRVFVMGTSGRLYAIDAKTGGKIWEAYPTQEHQNAFERSKKAGRSVFKGAGFNQAPCAIDGVVAIAKNPSTLVGFDAATGERLWEAKISSTGAGRGCSVIPIIWNHRGSRFFVCANSCIEPRTGKVLWAIPKVRTTTAPCVTEDYFIGSGIGGMKGPGSTCFRISPQGYEKLWSLPNGRSPSMGCTDAVSGDYFIQEASYQSKDGKSVNSVWLVELATGKKLAAAPSYRHVGYSPITCRGTLYGGLYSATSIRLNPDALECFAMKDRAMYACSTSPALVGTRLYVRGGTSMLCYELKK